jgi:hypothetical protein
MPSKLPDLSHLITSKDVGVAQSIARSGIMQA